MSECGCVWMGDGEEPEFCSTRVVKARKSHTCCECRLPISVGELYEYTSGKWDGRMDVHQTCLPCVEIRNTLGCDGYIFGMLWESVRDYFADGGKAQGCIDKLASVAAKEKLAAAFQKHIGLT
jgi:hypothetical protein